jgi:hypothetical protein
VVLIKEFLAFQAAPTALAVLTVFRRTSWRNEGRRLIAIYWLAALVSLPGLAKVGANHNYWIELAAANSVLSSLALWSIFRARGLLASVTMWLLVAQLALIGVVRMSPDRSTDVIPRNASLALDALSRQVGEAPEFDHLVVDVGGEPELVLADTLDIAVLGNHPIAIEPFAYRAFELTGSWDSSEFVQQVCSGRVTLLVLSYPLERDPYPGAGVAWPPSVLAALRDSMRFEQIRAVHWLYRSKPASDPQTIAACEADAAAHRSHSPI